MSVEPIIAFGQQPCGFFPRRFLVAKIHTARRLRAQMGGCIVFFYHDSDHDPRETRTILRHRTTGESAALNFSVGSKLQRKFSPLYVKRIDPEWHARTLRQLPNYVDGRLIDLFRKASAETVADFCLEMYRRMGLLEGIHVSRSSDPALRRSAAEVSDFFLTVAATAFAKEQISPARDTRFRWMQSVVQCTHYVTGAGEQAYLRRDEAPEITFVRRDEIDRSDEAYTELPP